MEQKNDKGKKNEEIRKKKAAVISVHESAE